MMLAFLFLSAFLLTSFFMSFGLSSASVVYVTKKTQFIFSFTSGSPALNIFIRNRRIQPRTITSQSDLIASSLLLCWRTGILDHSGFDQLTLCTASDL